MYVSILKKGKRSKKMGGGQGRGDVGDGGWEVWVWRWGEVKAEVWWDHT